MWNQKKMGLEPTDRGKSYCEIDESKIINYNNETRWLFGIYDWGIKERKIFLWIIIERKKLYYL